MWFYLCLPYLKFKGNFNNLMLINPLDLCVCVCVCVCVLYPEAYGILVHGPGIQP